jgi:chemotaxis signal transduction protein
MQRDFARSLKSALVLVNLEFEDTSHRVGIIVDEVLEIEVFETLELQSAPQFGLSFDTKYVESMAHYEGKYIPILSLDRLLWLEELSVLKEL